MTVSCKTNDSERYYAQDRVGRFSTVHYHDIAIYCFRGL